MSLKAGFVPEEPVNVGVDDGYAAVKLAWQDPDGTLRTFSVPSRIQQGSFGIGTLTSDARVGGYETEGLFFTVGIEGEETRFPDFNLSPLARVLAHHALDQAGFEGRPVRIASGLPLNRYFLRIGKPDEEQIAGKIESFARPVIRADGGETVRIVQHKVFAQGLAAALDWLSDPKRRTSGEVGIVDIGGQTTDISVVLPGLLRERVATYDIGVLSVHDLLRRRVCGTHRVDDVPSETLEKALATGSLQIWGKNHDVGKECEAVIHDVWSQLERRIRSVFEKKIASLDVILFVGGGSHIFRNLLATFPNAVIPEKPEFANARGLLKALSVSGRK
ncbi:hypothetical protein ABH19_02415 [Leptospirillum sp. Group II 'CF-1']|jgi:plasmid segregation protein ParM|uniref:ParM/StbA family protein n=1 Tax=Leptospirillum sp. Group II 'CF-1' TaxID=1660083 RepID=UPI0006728635|nr:ParM/StbA family protein [Leptospirillum sp. Group II 'CF-1']AKS22846.1 hypothetical protein ABH19_02415 [Leptospirillum sp. Group II 'CF-1']